MKRIIFTLVFLSLLMYFLSYAIYDEVKKSTAQDFADYQKILAEVHNAKPLTIRDRIAYARRHGWIESVGHGERTSNMTRLAE
jgi:hypothetical protein